MVGRIVFLLIAVNFFHHTLALDDFAICDRTIHLYPNIPRTLNSDYWPFSGYMPGSSCRYQIQAPIDYQIRVTCKLDMKDPKSDGSCSSEKFYIALDGRKDISNIQPICGTKTISQMSIGNKLTLAYTSSLYSGTFSCSLTTVCDCGWGYQSRIVGGQEALPNEFPPSAALISLRYNATICGATIVSSRFVVTAAHCLSKTDYYTSAVLVGDHDLKTGTDTTEAKLYRVLYFYKHPQYSSQTDTNDIGLVQTLMSMTWSRGVGPVCLPFYYPDADFSGVDVIATGWGTTEFGGPLPNHLRKVDLTILKNDECRSTYPNIQDSQVCAFKEGKDTCQYDSGGPLYYSASRYFLIAQVSSGKGCGSSSPSLNTRMTSFMKWIESYTGTLCRRAIY